MQRKAYNYIGRTTINTPLSTLPNIKILINTYANSKVVMRDLGAE